MLALPGFQASAQTTPDSAAAQAAAIPARITQAIDETQLVTLNGNVHGLARPEFDQGAAPPNLPMERMLLLLKRSVEQDAALDQLMIDQYNLASPSFHKWLTPEQFGSQFGPADADIQTVTSWLQSHGLQVARVTKGKIAIEFSGTAAQVKEAFHTEIHNYLVNGEQHWANASDPQIPAALAPVLHGFFSLHNFQPKPMHHVAGAFFRSKTTGEVAGVRPEFNTAGGNFGIVPSDFATIYNVTPLWTAGTDGTGQSIAVLGVSNINLQDVTDFRTLFGLPTGGAANTPIVVIDGSDPGIINDGSETEALLDVEWSGAVAKNAQIHFVIAADTNSASGLDLAALHVIDFNSDPIMSVSFGACELQVGTGGNTGRALLWQQAAAQGITVTVATGDDGSAGCENQNIAAPNPATTGLQVSAFASTPFNVAVGGTDFNDAGIQTTYFNATNDPTTQASAKSYIPESTWNESCTNLAFGAAAEANCNSTLAANKAAVFTVGGSGGPSHCTASDGVTPASCTGGYPKPNFQKLAGLTGMPADGLRDVPDVSLFASSGFNKSFYIICQADDPSVTPATSCKGQNFQFIGIGGTSASSPSFASILALVNQSELTAGSSGRQGNANFVLYQLALAQIKAATACASVASPLPAAGCTFNDVTTGTIAMPCTKGSANCTTTGATDTIGVLQSGTTQAWLAGAGYDQATGLGSVNATNLVNNWSKGLTALTISTTALTLNNGAAVNITHGTAVPVTISVTPTSATGAVSLVSTATTGQGVDGFTLGANATVTGTTNQLTGGTYTVKAHYPGDGVVGPSDSAPVSVTVSPQGSLTVTSVFADRFGTPFLAGTYPQTAFLRADVSDSPNSGNFVASGTVNFVDDTTTTLASNVGVSTDSAAFTGPVLLSGGAHSVVANYSGDPSFTASSSTALTFNITAASSTTTGSGPASVGLGQSATLTATVQTQALAPAVAPTGSITFKNGTTTIGTANVSGVAGGATGASASASFNATFNTAGAQTITVAYSGDTNYAASTSASFTVNVTTTGSFTVGGAAATVAAGGMGSSTITITPTGGFTSTGVAITCGVLPGVTCSALSIPVPNANAAMGTLTVNVTAPSSSMTAMTTPAKQDLWATSAPLNRGGGKGWWTLSAGTGLAGIVLLLLPGRKRYRAAMGLGLICMVSFAIGCGSSTSSGGGGPVATTTHLTVSATKLKTTDTLSVSATVTGGTPAASVQFFVDGAAAGTAAPVTGGTTGNIMLTAANAPPLFQLIGTHTLSAHYLGDANTQASNSGTLNIAITGTTQLAITANPAPSNANPTISLTIN